MGRSLEKRRLSNREASARRRARLSVLGLCLRCGHNPGRYRYCFKCRISRAVWGRKRYREGYRVPSRRKPETLCA